MAKRTSRSVLKRVKAIGEFVTRFMVWSFAMESFIRFGNRIWPDASGLNAIIRFFAICVGGIAMAHVTIGARFKDVQGTRQSRFPSFYLGMRAIFLIFLLMVAFARLWGR